MGCYGDNMTYQKPKICQKVQTKKLSRNKLSREYKYTLRFTSIDFLYYVKQLNPLVVHPAVLQMQAFESTQLNP